MSSSTERIAALEAALACDGETLERHLEIGSLKLERQDFRGAVAAYRRCAELRPGEPRVYNSLGAALLLDRQIEAAIVALETACALDRDYHRPLVNLGKALREAGRPGEAIVRLRRALRLAPDDIGALINLGDALAASGDLPASQAMLERAARLAPKLPEAQRSLAVARLQAGRVAESVALLQSALRHAPENASLHCCLHEALFAAGDWQQAWPHFEWRFAPHEGRTPFEPPRNLPRWDGTLHGGLKLSLLGEQGLGDQIQFVRYAKLLAQSGLSCTISCDKRLVRLLGSAGLRARVVARGAPVDEAGACWVPLMSLPAHHGTRPDNVPHATGYFTDDVARVAQWRSVLNKVPRPRIALAWSGNPSMEFGRHGGRSFPLAALTALLAVGGARFLSLQKGHGAAQADVEPFRSSLLRFPDFDPDPDGFVDTAAILRCVDLLITSDSAIAHLAGALGVRTWLCLHFDPDWRWPRAGTTTPWYASVRLFRQQRPGDWAGVFERVAAELRTELSA